MDKPYRILGRDSLFSDKPYFYQYFRIHLCVYLSYISYSVSICVLSYVHKSRLMDSNHFGDPQMYTWLNMFNL